MKRFLLFLFFLCAAANIAAAAPAPQHLPPATEAKLRELLNSPAMQQAHVGISIIALGSVPDAQTFPAKAYDDKSAPQIFSSDADKRFLPASNLKLFTACLALSALGPEYTFATRVETSGTIKNGVLKGVILLWGGGDPSLGREGLSDLAQQLKNAGIKRVENDIIGDGSMFRAETFGGRWPDGWTLDDSLWYYGPEISALAFERNQVDIIATGADHAGQPATVRFEPDLKWLLISSDIKTVQREALPAGDLLQIARYHLIAIPGMSYYIEVQGSVAPSQKLTEGLAVPEPERMAALALKQELQQSGIKVSGSGSAVSLAFRGALLDGPEITHTWIHTSPPIKVLLHRFLKNSDNLYGEMLLRASGLSLKGKWEKPAGNTSDEGIGSGIASTGDAARGHKLLWDWMEANNIPTQGLRMTDGSGLSRYDLVTPRSVAELLRAAQSLPGAGSFYDALPIAGRDGTLKDRFKNSSAENNVRAKTGTFSIASCLSGYVTTRDGQRLAVSILTNFAPDTKTARQFQEAVFIALADADFRAQN